MAHIAVSAQRVALALGLLTLLSAGIRGQEPILPRVVVVPLEDQVIHPITKRFVVRALHAAADRRAECVILQLDTRGGLLDSTRHIVNAILASDVPVVVYIAPNGARADSAGVFIALSAHVTVMAPGTHIGAVQPIALTSGIFLGNDEPGERVIVEKIPNEVAAWARYLAKQRGRNAEWADHAVRESTSTSANEAVALHVVDFLAVDQDELLKRLDGWRVSMPGREVVLRTKGALVERVDMSWPERLLGVLANPTLAYLLMLLGFAGLMVEFTHPGAWIPGFLGLTCLVLSCVAMSLLPINYVGLALIVLGLLLVALELKVQCYGCLTVLGIIGLLLGSAMLIEPVGGVERVSWLVVAPVSIALALIVLLLVGRVVRAHQTKVQTGMERLIGAAARVRGDMDGIGYVFVAGELWHAHCHLPLQDGETVTIVGFKGLTLYVKPVGENETRKHEEKEAKP